MAPHAHYPGVEHLSFSQIADLNYKEQAVWFLNGFWGEGEGGLGQHAETVWGWHKIFAELDLHATVPRGAEGSALDPILSAKFLERTEQTLTSLERKAALREIDVNNDGRMALVEYLMHAFKVEAGAVVTAQQGKAQEVQACQHVIDQAIAMLPEIEANLKAQLAAQREAAAALAEVKAAKADAEAALAVQIDAEKALRQALSLVEEAKDALQRAVNELLRQEQAVQDEMARLQAVTEDSAAGVVHRGRAHNQLHGLRNEDPLPLRKAKITQEAALRAVQKRERAAAKKHADAAAKTAETRAKFEELQAKEVGLEERQADLAAAVRELEASYAEMSRRMAEAQEAIEELKKQMCGLGAVWWMERELFEADESLPRSKQKYDHSQPFEFAAPGSATLGQAQAPAAKPPAPATAIAAKKVIAKNNAELTAMVSG